jgi:hypothetical protein
MSAYVTVVAVGLGSYLLRVSMLVLTARIGGVPSMIERAAHYAIPVSFAALATDALAAHVAVTRTQIAPAASVLVAIIAVGRTRWPHAAIVAGLPTLWIATALTGS